MNWTPYIVFAAAILVVVVSWYAFEGSWDRRLFSAEPGKVFANLDAAQAAAWLREHPETQVLDVRSESEFAGGALPAAVNISLGDEAFESKVGKLDRERPVLVYCAGGFRSRKAMEVLKGLGFKNIQHLHRGYLSWKPGATP
ncbi:MAG: rhodanese-like domain-containing protein [Verrucomicrobiae bacterium]|nr:rhodanese-like domain-containing protein [Verrucomicrobiae bacterium]